jgi:hypothetical protein
MAKKPTKQSVKKSPAPLTKAHLDKLHHTIGRMSKRLDALDHYVRIGSEPVRFAAAATEDAPQPGDAKWEDIYTRLKQCFKNDGCKRQINRESVVTSDDNNGLGYTESRFTATMEDSINQEFGCVPKFMTPSDGMDGKTVHWLVDDILTLI